MNIFKKLLGAAALVLIGLAGFGTASPAHAAITCAAYGTGRNSYPQDGTHAFRCTNTATNTKPTDSRATTLFDTVSDTRFPASAKNRLKNANVLYFFFNNQADADTYFKNTSPYNQQWPMASVIRDFNGAALNTQCANTGMISYLGTLYIAVAVYDTCVYQTNGVATSNPDLPHIVLHESGHAYDFTFASGMAANETASKKTFWRQSVQGDWGALTPSNWNSLTAAQKGSVAKNLWHRNQPVFCPANACRHYTFCDAEVSEGSGGAETAGLRWNIPRTTKTTSGKTPITTNVISPAIRAQVNI